MITALSKAVHHFIRFIVILRLDRRIQKLREKLDSPLMHTPRNYGERIPGKEIR